MSSTRATFTTGVMSGMALTLAPLARDLSLCRPAIDQSPDPGR